jgi:Rieske Fe-S protein
VKRREFIVVTVGAAAACGSKPQTPCTQPDGGYFCGQNAVALGVAVTDVQPMTAMKIMLPAQDLWLCRDLKGIYAMSAECTHLGCDADFVDPQHGFSCPCHGATFAFDGQSPTSPAPSPLQHFLVCATVSGILVVDLDQPVDPCTRYHV